MNCNIMNFIENLLCFKLNFKIKSDNSYVIEKKYDGG